MSGTISPSPVLTLLDSNGDPLASGKLYTYSAGTTTPVATYTDSTLGTPNANPVIADAAGRVTLWLSPGVSYKYVCKTSADVTVWTSDNLASVPAANLALDIDGVAGENLSENDAVYLSSGSGGGTAGRWYKTDSDNTYSSSAAAVAGMVPAAISTGNTGSVRLQGRLTGMSGLSAGTIYYAGPTPGLLTSSAPTNALFMGAADSSTSIVLQPSASATAGLDSRITALEGQMTTANTNIATNTANIATNTSGIATNVSDISTINSWKTLVGNTIVVGTGYIVDPYTKTISHTAGTGTNTGRASMFFDSVTTAVGCSGTSETSAWSKVLTGGSLNTDGKTLAVIAFGDSTGNGNTKTIRFKFGGTTYTATISSVGTQWIARAYLVRTGAATQVGFIETNSPQSAYGAASETLSGNVTCALTIQGGASNDLYVRGLFAQLL